MRTLIKMLKRTRSSAGIAVAAFLVIAGVGAGLTLADTNDPNTPVYDTILGETVPLSFQQARKMRSLLALTPAPSSTRRRQKRGRVSLLAYNIRPRLRLQIVLRQHRSNKRLSAGGRRSRTDVTAGADDEDLDTGRFIRQDTNFSNESTSSSTADDPGRAR